ncbi:MAG TPA: DUF4384 domain-containing protein [Pyrinomonadaceae bacterium]|nr:DUF4384 domain-containing protein [Pyrinomonadaceae bacterium]
MRSKTLVALVGGLALVCGMFVVSAQEPSDDDVRGAFLSSRPKTTNSNAPSHRHRPRQTNSNSSNTSSSGSKNANTNTAAANTNSAHNTNSSKNESQAIGLGYTLFMKDAGGRGVRIEPTHEFHNGDSVRLALEPNVDGYLYIFDVENENAPQMIYPDPRLDAGDNSVEAHVPIEIPSSEETDERFRWFTFYGNGGNEHLYVVVTREPLNGVPTGNELVGFCATQKDKCPWRPSSDVWAQVQDANKAEVKVVTATTFGQAQSDKEKTATTRGLGLDQSAPLPSVIRMNASTKAPALVTVLDLVHK